MAGFSKMRGLSGKPDYVGASALWKIAAESGDSLSQYELALLLMYGTGVQPDVKEAIRLFRLARREIPKANLQLSAALLPSSMAGEIAAAEEGVQAAEESIRLLEKTPGEGTAHWLLGTYLTIAAPVRFKDMSRGIDEFERAIGTGMTAGAYSIAEAYRTGNGKPQDLACALAFYKEAEKSSKADVKDKIDELVPQLGEEGKARAERIRSRIAHPQNAWADFPELVSHFGPPEDTTWHSACDLSKQEG